jgi:hypothetical protein
MGIFLITPSLIYAVCAFSFIVLNYAKQTFTFMHPVDFHKKFCELMESGFGIVEASDGYILLRKGEGKRELPDEFFDFARAANPQPSYPVEVNF